MNTKSNEKSNMNNGTHCFIGISFSSSATDDTGIVILNPEKQILKIDKAYTLDEIRDCINRINGKDNAIICADLPKYNTMLNGKWRIESKHYKTFNLNGEYQGRDNWTQRFSERGSDLCKQLLAQGYRVYRYNSDITKTLLGLHPPVKSKTPAACKFLQQSIKEKLGVDGLPSNMVPRSGLDAILGAYIGMCIANGEIGKDYKETGIFKDIPVMSVV